jgi:hypothetical protein
MAGRGPAPKPANRRARTNATTGTTILRYSHAIQPALPDDIEWHPRTRDWWATWADSSQADTFTSTDWDFLLDTALMHHAMWSKGQWTLAAEVRLRVAKFGATPEDRARLRMVFADADAADEKRALRVSSQDRFGPLRMEIVRTDALETK